MARQASEAQAVSPHECEYCRFIYWRLSRHKNDPECFELLTARLRNHLAEHERPAQLALLEAKP